MEVGLQGLRGMKPKWGLGIDRFSFKGGWSWRGAGLVCMGSECLELCS